MPTWPAKDPDWVADYRYDAPLDEGDTIVTISIETLAGTVNIDGSDGDETGITAWLSGGTNGEIAVFRVNWTTTAGREADAVITMAVAANEPTALSGYDKPSPADLIRRYPAFSSVDPGAIQYWLTDAERMVDTSWSEGDYAPALMALAAHNMSLGGLGGKAGVTMPVGVTRFRSGSMDVAFSEAAANAQASAGYTASRYGREFVTMLRRRSAGPRVLRTLSPCYGR